MAWAIDEFEKTVSTELDFREEAQHAGDHVVRGGGPGRKTTCTDAEDFG